MHTDSVLTVGLGDRAYDIIVGRDLLDRADTLATIHLADRHVIIVSDHNVASNHMERLAMACGRVARRCDTLTLAAGEASKNMQVLSDLLEDILALGVDRGVMLVALGGGVVGDLVGFAAASLLRGVDFIQVPSSLLAQVDSSVGGKTGVNAAAGKNLIGAFHQPQQVVVDLDTLATLPTREYAAGLAEVIKYGLIRDAEFFVWLIDNVEALKGREAAALAFAIERSCAIKAAVVAADEREGGVRAHLNFGHTFGHAIERIQGYGDWLHGEAVAAGMVLASRLSVLRGTLDSEVVDQLTAFNQAVGLPVAPPAGVTTQAMLEAMGSDKKVSGGKVRYIVLSQLGEAVVAENVTDDDIARVIDA